MVWEAPAHKAGCRTHYPQKSSRCAVNANIQRRKEAKIRGLRRVLASRKPTPMPRLTGKYPYGKADRSMDPLGGRLSSDGVGLRLAKTLLTRESWLL